MKKLLLRNSLCPGDIVMLTAALRDLHRTYPKQFITDVRTTCGDLWMNNPYLTPLAEDDPEVQNIDCEYPLINRCNTAPFHFIHGFARHLSEVLNLRIEPTEFRGDIHISDLEKSWISQVHEITQEDTRFWIIVAGGKHDYTIKWWDHARWQKVVDHFEGRLTFVQVGESQHHHRPLKGVIDLVGRTNLRQLVRLVYHSDGVLCPVTSLMHLAAAVEYRRRPNAVRPCVVVAGGREPVHWEAYPGHQFLHTIGMLPCCAKGGCWKSRSVPLGDGDSKDHPDSLCVDLAGSIPRCMDMIRPEAVIEAVENYLTGCPWLGRSNPRMELRFPRDDRRTGDAGPGSEEFRNEVEISVTGPRRSGLHAIINWVAGCHAGKACFINDINHQKTPVSATEPCSDLPAIESERRVPLSAKKELLLHGYEECGLAGLAKWRLPHSLTGASRRRWDLLVLRDPYNSLASRITAFRRDPGNVWTEELIRKGEGGLRAFMALWMEVAQEYLELEAVPRPGVMGVNFNRWHLDNQYREEIAHRMGASTVSGDSRETVTPFGFGSSFDYLRFNGRASEMQLQHRWRTCLDDPLFKEALDVNEEVHEISERIFGPVLLGGALPGWLRRPKKGRSRKARANGNNLHGAAAYPDAG